ncbi:MAG: acetylglutamate kinase [Candidatus Limnocylindrales bacterium]
MANAREPVRLALRQLWTDHIQWTRGYIIDAVEGATISPHIADAAYSQIGDLASTLEVIKPKSATDAAAVRLLKNQEDIGNAIVPYYGTDAGAALTKLLKDHIVIAVGLVENAKGGDQAAFAANDQKWTDNIRDIARFLSGANPAWPENDVFDLLNQHLNLTKGEVVARLQKNWAADVKVSDDLLAEAMVIADTLYDGLVAQFPDRFTDGVPTGVAA